MNKLKDPIEYGIVIPKEVNNLINKFDSTIKIKIEDTSKLLAQAPIHNSKIIVLSRGFFNEHKNIKFITNDILVIVAHELGHIVLKSHFVKLFWISFICIAISSICIIISLLCLSMKDFFYNSFSLMLFLLYLGYISRNEEIRADKFAILKANVSIEEFTQCFSKIETVLEKEDNRKNIFISSINKTFFNFHPEIKQRILTVQSLTKK